MKGIEKGVNKPEYPIIMRLVSLQPIQRILQSLRILETEVGEAEVVVEEASPLKSMEFWCCQAQTIKQTKESCAMFKNQDKKHAIIHKQNFDNVRDAPPDPK